MATRRLGEILLEKQLIFPQALEHALLEQKKTGELLGRTLIRLGYISERQLLEGLAEHLQLPIVSLKQVTIDQQIVKKIPARGGCRISSRSRSSPPNSTPANPASTSPWKKRWPDANRSSPDSAMTNRKNPST